VQAQGFGLEAVAVKGEGFPEKRPQSVAKTRELGHCCSLILVENGSALMSWGAWLNIPERGMNKGELIKSLAEAKDIHPNEAQEVVT
jgi:hypothetical protein